MNNSLLPANDTHRKIIHLDMDAFYASVEHRDHPEFENKAVVVGQDPRLSNGHGVVATADYLARRYGVHSAMPAIEALRLVPYDLLSFVKPNFEKYRAVSHRIHCFMHEVTDKIEPVALDEAYLDVTQNKKKEKSVVSLGNFLQEKIYRVLHLTSSFGVSYNKLLAKMGSEYAKPFGKTIILPQETESFLDRKDIAEFPGIGKKTQESLRKNGINTGRQLRQANIDWLIKKYKKMGYIMAMHARGIDLSPVVFKRQSKSLGKERTFEPNLFSEKSLLPILHDYATSLSEELKEKKLMSTCLVLKIRDHDFNTATKRKKLSRPSQDPALFYRVGQQLLTEEKNFLARGVRLIGLTVTDLSSINYVQIDLFNNED